jgi:membrane protease YdiL (CAAX protease family)
MTSAAVADTPANLPARPTGRLVAWVVLVLALAGLSYAGRYLLDGEEIKDPLYRWSTAVGALIQYGFMLILIVAIAHGLDRRLLGLRMPDRRRRAAGLAVAAFATIIVVSAILSQFLDAGDEQGLVPKSWDSTKAAPFIANAIVVAIVAPFVEELLYRGLGYGLLTQFISVIPAIVLTGLAFGLGHGLVLGLPVLAFFGITLAWLRWQTGSVYPGMVVHGTFNALALVLVVLK